MMVMLAVVVVKMAMFVVSQVVMMFSGPCKERRVCECHNNSRTLIIT